MPVKTHCHDLYCPVCKPVLAPGERWCSECYMRGGEHQRGCSELQAMLDMQAMQTKTREAGCSHAYPEYRDGRCMGCGELRK
jgi:hypothetical protein